MKSFQRPKRDPVPPGRPMIEGFPTMSGALVTHPVHGDGVLQWCEWRLRENDEWVPPLERDVETGHWVAVVSIKFGSYKVPLDELRLRKLR